MPKPASADSSLPAKTATWSRTTRASAGSGKTSTPLADLTRDNPAQQETPPAGPETLRRQARRTAGDDPAARRSRACRPPCRSSSPTAARKSWMTCEARWPRWRPANRRCWKSGMPRPTASASRTIWTVVRLDAPGAAGAGRRRRGPHARRCGSAARPQRPAGRQGMGRHCPPLRRGGDDRGRGRRAAMAVGKVLRSDAPVHHFLSGRAVGGQHRRGRAGDPGHRALGAGRRLLVHPAVWVVPHRCAQ